MLWYGRLMTNLPGTVYQSVPHARIIRRPRSSRNRASTLPGAVLERGVSVVSTAPPKRLARHRDLTVKGVIRLARPIGRRALLPACMDLFAQPSVEMQEVGRYHRQPRQGIIWCEKRRLSDAA